jgi:hypothetical protein
MRSKKTTSDKETSPGNVLFFDQIAVTEGMHGGNFSGLYVIFTVKSGMGGLNP